MPLGVTMLLYGIVFVSYKIHFWYVEQDFSLLQLKMCNQDIALFPHIQNSAR